MKPVKLYKYPYPVRKKYTPGMIQEIMDFYGDNRSTFGRRFLKSAEWVKSLLKKGKEPLGGDNLIMQQLETEMLRQLPREQAILSGTVHQNNSFSERAELESLGQKRMFN